MVIDEKSIIERIGVGAEVLGMFLSFALPVSEVSHPKDASDFLNILYFIDRSNREGGGRCCE